MIATYLPVLALVLGAVMARPRVIRSTDNQDQDSQPIVETKYGSVTGRRHKVSEEIDLDIFLGVRYAKAPVGNLRLARPQNPDPWTLESAFEHGPLCPQREIASDPTLDGVPYKEDCLFLDIYTPRYRNVSKVPTMMFIHGGGYYGGTGALYNFTNLALKGVTVVSVNYRLDVFGFLSTQDDVIPGNFGLLDQILALEWLKDNIGNFGGDPEDITLFGGSAGAASTSILSLSPLTRGTFQKAILQSGFALCSWAVYTPGVPFTVPNDIAKKFGQALNCSLSERNFSQELLDCIRQVPFELLANESVKFQETYYQNNMIFVPVVEQTFGVIPDTPLNLLRKSNELVRIPTIYGYTADDGSWLVNDPDNNGTTLDEFKQQVLRYTLGSYPSEEYEAVYKNALSTYLPKDPSSLSSLELRDILVESATDASQRACAIQEARLFSKASKGDDSKTYLFNFNHRPTYSTAPKWRGVGHADEKGFVLGLPAGPDPFKYPIHSDADETVRDFVVTTWTNFAKYGNPTPEPVQQITWPEFDSKENIMFIQETPEVQAFNRSQYVEVWYATPNPGNLGNRSVLHTAVLQICFVLFVVLSRF